MGYLFTASTYDVTTGNIVYAADLDNPFTAIDAAFTSVISAMQHSTYQYAADTGSANAYAVAPTPAITSYAEGHEVWLKPANTNTGASTINVNSLGVVSIRRFGLQAVEAGDLNANYYVHLKYDGTYYQIVSTAGSANAAAATSAAEALASATAAQTAQTAAELAETNAEAAAATLDIGSFTAEGNSGAALEIDTNDEVHSLTISEACSITFANWPASGTHRTVMLVITNGSAFTITWPAAVKWPGNVEPSLTASGRDRVVFATEDGGTTIDAAVGGLGFA